MIGIKDVDGLGVDDQHDGGVILEELSESFFTLFQCYFLLLAVGNVVNDVVNERFALDLDFFGKYFYFTNGSVGSAVGK